MEIKLSATPTSAGTLDRTGVAKSHSMPIEVEQKFPVADLAGFERLLAPLNPSAGETVRQSDAYFNHPSRDFAATDEAVRIRRVGQTNYMTYKGPKLDATTKTRRELEIELAPGEGPAADATAMLLALGFRPVARVHKQRRHVDVSWQGREVCVALDEVDDLGCFVELEIIANEGSVEDAQACLTSLAARLNLANAERRSYLELLLNRVS
jgi:adenylate cyclase class 2